MSYFLPDSPKPFQISPSYFPDPGTNHDAHDNVVCSVHNLSNRKVSLNPPLPAFISRKVASCDTLAISTRLGFRHDHCKCKKLDKVDGNQNVHNELFSSHLANYEIFLQSGASYLHEHWFLNRCLDKGRQNMENRDNVIFMQSPGDLVVDISRC